MCDEAFGVAVGEIWKGGLLLSEKDVIERERERAMPPSSERMQRKITSQLLLVVSGVQANIRLLFLITSIRERERERERFRTYERRKDRERDDDDDVHHDDKNDKKQTTIFSLQIAKKALNVVVCKKC